MDNATKAILMAGGVLIVLLILSLAVMMFRSIRTMDEAVDSKAMAQELQKWNSEWEAYNKQVMYGADVLTVVNKAAQVNHELADYPNYHVTIKVKGIDMNTELESNKNSIFTCKEIHYNKETGRVDGMTFELRK